MDALRSLGIEVEINTMPVEIPDPVRFTEDTAHASYDPVYANRHWRILAQIEQGLQRVPLALHRQVQPRPLLLGQLRPGGDALFGTPRARA